MAENQSTGQGVDHDAEEPADGSTDPSPLQRAWQFLRAAGEWVADTFKGHSGAHQLKERDR